MPEAKQYQIERLKTGASPSTVNWENGTLSRIFQVLTELRLMETNPCRLVKNLSQKSEERQVYLGLEDVQSISDRSPSWLSPIVWTAFYTGMRQGEILGLRHCHIHLAKRMIHLGPEDTKEGHWKRVPIPLALLPTLEVLTKVRQIGVDNVFSVKG